jgi:hypothetical protein
MKAFASVSFMFVVAHFTSLFVPHSQSITNLYSNLINMVSLFIITKQRLMGSYLRCRPSGCYFNGRFRPGSRGCSGFSIGFGTKHHVISVHLVMKMCLLTHAFLFRYFFWGRTIIITISSTDACTKLKCTSLTFSRELLSIYELQFLLKKFMEVINPNMNYPYMFF